MPHLRRRRRGPIPSALRAARAATAADARAAAGGAVERIVDWDGGLLLTAAVLTHAPERVIRDTFAARGIFWRARRNLAEHLVIALYLLGHVLLLAALLQPLLAVLPRGFAPAAGAAATTAVVYVARAHARSFDVHAAFGAAGGELALAGGLGLWFVAVAALVQALR